MVSQQLKRYQWIQLAVFLTTLGLGLLILLKVENMLVSALLAFVMSYLLTPPIEALERSGLKRSLSIVIVFILLTITIITTVYLLAPFISSQVNSFKAELPKYIVGTTELIQEVEVGVKSLTGTEIDLNLSRQVEALMLNWTQSLFEDLPNIISKSLTIILLAPFLAFFLLKDGQSISRQLLALVPNNIFEMTLNLHHQINNQMGQFVRARLLEALIVGLVVWLGLTLISFPYATLLAMFAMLTNLIPYIGPFIGAIPALVIALINGEPFLSLLLVANVFLVAQIIDVVFIIPLVVAKIVDLHPVTVAVSLLIGAQLMGVVGMLISIPVASVIKVTSQSIYRHGIHFRG